MKIKGILKQVIFIFLATTLWGTANSQQLIENSLYFFNALNYNPAYSGTRDALALSLIHRQQWTGIDGAPESSFITVHSPSRKDYLSWGVTASYEELGVTKVTNAMVALAYRVQLNERRHFLSFGIGGGINVYDINTTLLRKYDLEYILTHDTENELKFNVNSGIYYYGERHYLGLSFLNMLDESVLDNARDTIPGFRTVRHYYFMGGYVFDLKSMVKMKPYFLVKAAEGAPINWEVHLDFLLFDKLWVGAMYRDEDIGGLKAVYNITDQLRVGYSYDHVFSDVSRYTNGSHEFLLSYDFDFAKRKFKSPRYF